MGKNGIYIAAGLIIAVILVGVGWSLGAKSTQNNIPEKAVSATGSASAQGLFSEEKPKDIITLKVNTPDSFHSGREIVMEKYGFLEREGIKLEYVGVIKTENQLAALQAGQIDVISGHPDRFINAIKGGFKIKGVVAGGFGHPIFPHHDMYVLENSPIREPKDLIGKKVATSPSQVGSWDLGCGGFYWSGYFKLNNISKDQVIPVNIPEPQHEQALKQGLVDVITAGPTYSAAYKKKGGFRKLWSSWDIAVGKNLSTSPIDKQFAEIGMSGFTEEFIKKNPEAVRRYVAAYVKAGAFTIDNHDISSEYVGALQGFPPNVEGEHHSQATGIVRDRALQLWIDWYEDIGRLKPGELKPQDLYTNEFNPYSVYKENDPVKNPTFYDTYQLEWAKKRNVSLPAK